ncbi:sigma 70 (RpoD) [Caballeronia arvi]|uniref:Sigma 70 (RpoD) n=1 Tax=Caballeronia arvi TaxID=1777135 RepID=A0A158KGG3_9BURK|nr:sigma 70 (RpoD) [Caballeronia arvi]
MGVAVYEQTPDAETLLLNDATPAAMSDDQTDEEAEVTLAVRLRCSALRWYLALSCQRRRLLVLNGCATPAQQG